MKTILLLTKVGLINTFNLHALNPKHFKSKKDALKILLFVVVILALIPAYRLYLSFIRQMSFSLLMLGQETYFMAIAHYVAVMMVFFLGLTYVLSYYYFSRDTDLLIPLPIKSRHLVISKFFSLLIYEYILLSVFFIPVIFINHSLTGGGLIYYLKAVLLYLLTPVVPLSLASILIIVIMRFTNVSGKKDLIRVVTMFLFLFVLLGTQILIQRSMIHMAPGEEQAFLANLFTDNRYLIDQLGRFYPLSQMTSLALYTQSATSWLQLIGVLAFSAGAFVLMIFVSETLYLGGIIGGNEASSKKKAFTESDLEKASSKTRSPFLAVFKVDWITLFKTPIYLFNCVSIVVLLPFIFLVMPLVSGAPSEMDFIIDLFHDNRSLFVLGLSGAYCLMAALNPTASTCFSREGKTFYLSRIIPVSSREHIMGKALSPFLLQVATILFLSIGMFFFLPLTWMDLVVSGFLGLLGAIPIIFIGLLIDINRPMLSWDNPQRAVKQNLNVLISMALGGGLTVTLGFLTYVLIQLDLTLLVTVCIDSLLLIVIAWFVYRMLVRRLTHQFASIE
jgi:ABC-2 type transport system permease protein